MKRKHHITRDDTSHSRGLAGPSMWAGDKPCTVSSWLMSDMLSVSSSFISTKLPAWILSTSFLGKGAAAGDNAMEGSGGSIMTGPSASREKQVKALEKYK